MISETLQEWFTKLTFSQAMAVILIGLLGYVVSLFIKYITKRDQALENGRLEDNKQREKLTHALSELSSNIAVNSEIVKSRKE